MKSKSIPIIVALFAALAFSQGAAALSCNSGSLSSDDTCVISSNQGVSGQTVDAQGDLRVSSGTTLSTGSGPGNRADLEFDGDITIEGTLRGSFDLHGSNIDITSGASLNANGRGYSGGSQNYGDGSGPGGGSGSSNPNGGDNTADPNQPYVMGSGGGAGKKNGGDGAGAFLINGTGVVNVDGSITARGNSGGKTTYSGSDEDGANGAGGSVWIIGTIIDGSGSIDLDGASGTNSGNGENGRIAYEAVSINNNINEQTYQSFRTNTINNEKLKVKYVDEEGNPLDGVNHVTAVTNGTQYCSGSTNSQGILNCHLFTTQRPLPFTVEVNNTEALKSKGNPGLISDENRTLDGKDQEINSHNVTVNAEYVGNYGLNFTLYNQTMAKMPYDPITVKKAGTTVDVCKARTDYRGQVKCFVDRKELYDVGADTTKYKADLNFRNLRAPDNISIGKNQNFVPESTRSGSKKFSAGHVIPAQTFVTRPFSDFDVVNLSVEKSLKSDYRLVSDILVRKFNVDSPAAYSDWSNRQTVKIQEIYDRDWDDSGGTMNDAWGTIQFNPRGFQNDDCSDIRLTDSDGNLQDFSINQCTDSKVSMEFNVPIDALQGKNFYLYYGNSGASSAQSAVQRPSEFRNVDYDTGVTSQTETYYYSNDGGSVRDFNVTIPQNIAFNVREMELNGTRSKPKSNTVTDTLDEAYQANSGMKLRTKRDYMLRELEVKLASTTVDTEVILRNLNSSTVEHVMEIPDNGPNTYTINLKNSSKQRTGENTVLQKDNHYLIMVRDGQAYRRSSPTADRPMYDLTDTVLMHQNFNCNNDGTSCSEGDYPTLVKGMDTIDPDLPTNLNISLNNSQIYSGPAQLEDDVVDLSDDLESENWRIGDPLNDPKLHDFTVESESDGNLSMNLNTEVEFEHPVTQVSKDASACSVQPDSPTYFYFDFTDCNFLERINVTEGNWFRVDYRFRIPGPEDFGGPGSTNTYNITDTKVRFNVLTETEEFTP